ncbi:RUN and FYVE domain-containing protein 2 isoform X1 [Lucilia sericata]|uniref:RUN and FYVE domain-containing protein 2 isoform X1 n=1 Tax=Lucilia sericata TaxID=13632 RepID=UPI0018A84E85|nr:RUN and FYVE domain-containing protein 2 isoform X1 [Lucilia sericata]
MRALVEDTKKLSVNNNNNNNNDIANSEVTTTIARNSSKTASAATKKLNTKIATKTNTQQPVSKTKVAAATKTTVATVAKPSTGLKTPNTEKPTAAAAGEAAAKTSFTNKTYKMQQQQQQQQQTTITSTTNTNTKAGKAAANCPSPPTTGVKLRTKQQPQPKNDKKENHNNNTTTTGPTTTSSTTIALPKAAHANTTEEIAGGVQDTIYLCNFRVSVDGEWLCLKELQDIDSNPAISNSDGRLAGSGSGGGGGVGGQRPYSMYSQKHKRYSAGDRSSYGGGGGFEDNGIFALHNFIAGRRLYDEQGHAFHTNMLTAPHARESGFIGVFGGGGGGASQSSNEWSNLSRDPAEIERSNLVNICKLVVKELLEQSVRYGRMLDSDHLPLQHFFIVIEHVLGHGLRTKKGLLGPRKELWDLLQCVETYCPEAQDITASVRDLPTVRTHIGRARAWLRIALMQKKLSDYLQALIEHREDALYEYYEPHALMMSDEIVIIMGILVGLNVIDCNLCVKEEDLDSQQGVIDFSLYLRSSSRNNDNDNDEECNQTSDANGQGNMIAVLDQKNYIEELNRHLNATVANLQAKVESLTTTNALMKEDLAIARNSLLALQAENQAMRQNSQINAGPPSINSNQSDNSSNSKENDKAVVESLKAELEKEKKKSSELDKELKLQISLKAESDMAMKLLEKDIHEKQDTIVSLRLQLDEIKQINLEMYRKLQECEASLKHKTELLLKLESQKEDMASTIAHLEKKWSNDKVNLGEILKTTSNTLSNQVSASEERATRAEIEVHKERELRLQLQENELKLKEKIISLENKTKEFNDEVQKNQKLKIDLEKIRHQWSEAQTTLEELGIQLSENKLKVAELQEKDKRQQELLNNSLTSSQSYLNEIQPIAGAAGIWAPDSIATHCTACKKEFNLTRRKHHCRSCGEIFCRTCSDHTLPLLNENGQLGKPVRVCLSCFASHK